MAAARLEGGPWDGAATRAFPPHDPPPVALAVRPCPRDCGRHRLHARPLPGVAPDGAVTYVLVGEDVVGLLYRFEGLDMPGVVAGEVLEVAGAAA